MISKFSDLLSTTSRLLATCSLIGLANTMPSHSWAQSAEQIIPTDSAIASADPAWQRLLLSALERDSKIGKAAFQIDNLAAVAAPSEILAKCGTEALLFSGEAKAVGGKGDYTLAGRVPGGCKLIGLWVHRTPASNVRSVGLQVTDVDGEILKCEIADSWEGWKWCEFNLDGDKFEQAYPQKDRNSKIDYPLKSVNLIWYSSGAGATALAVDALVAVTSQEQTITRLTGELLGGSVMEPSKPLTIQYVATNFSAQRIEADLEVVLQRDSTLSAPIPPDPVLGADHALGAKSWTEYGGKVLEQGSLTDGDDHTDAKLPWSPGKYVESFQYVDLGRIRNILRLQTGPGDANWIRKVDVFASQDGASYVPIEGLQGVDLHGKWGANFLPAVAPFPARVLKLRYHFDGKATDSIAMPSSLAVFDGASDEQISIPALGERVFRDSRKVSVAARSFSVFPIESSSAVTAGAYSISALFNSGGYRLLTQASGFTMPAPLNGITNASRFGINGSDVRLAPILKNLGVGWFRFENMKWPMVSPSPGVYAFDGSVMPWGLKIDSILGTYSSLGIHVVPMMFMTPAYATSAPASVPEERRFAYPPKDNLQAAEFYAQTAARFGRKNIPAAELKTADKKSGLNLLPVVEVWNEQNLNDPGWGPWVGTAEQYFKMFRPAAEAVKKVDPTMIVSHGGLAGADIKLAQTLMEYKYPDGKCPLDFSDLLNLHYYSGRVPPEVATMDPNVYRTGIVQGGRTLENELQALAGWRDSYRKSLSIWVTETGYDSAGPYGIGERLQAARIPRVVMLMLGNGVEKVFIYRELGSDPSQHAASGLLRSDRSYKPSFFTYATLIRELDGATNGRRLPYPDPNVRLYSWNKGGAKTITAWSVTGNASANLPLGNCRVVDAFGHSRQMDINGKLELTEFPLYIHQIANYDGIVRTLEANAVVAQRAIQAEEDRVGKMQAVLFDFGTATTDATLKIGKDRPFVAVSKAKTYEGGADFGFGAGAISDDGEPWLANTLNKTFVRMGGGGSFTFKPLPGLYELRLSCPPLGESVAVTVSGAAETVSKTLTNDDSILQMDLRVTDQPITVTVGNYARLRWLTLVDKAVPSYMKPGAE